MSRWKRIHPSKSKNISKRQKEKKRKRNKTKQTNKKKRPGGHWWNHSGSDQWRDAFPRN